MKKIFNLSNAALAVATVVAASMLGSCSSEQETAGQGKLLISTAIRSDVKVLSRAATQEELAEKAVVWISNSRGAVRKYNGLANVPTEGITLLSDHYVAEVWTGDSVPASFDTKWFKGREEFDITNGQNTSVTVNCGIVNSVVSVQYADVVDELLSDYTLTVGHKAGELTLEGRDTRKGYFMMPSFDRNLTWTLQGKRPDGEVYTRTGVIENARPATEYVVKIGYTDRPQDPVGGGYLSIEIDENAIEVNDNMEITLAPQFDAAGAFDPAQPVEAEVGRIGRRTVFVRAQGNITSLVLEGAMINGAIGANDVDILAMSAEMRQRLSDGGINYAYRYTPSVDASVLRLNLEASMLNALSAGEHTLRVSATDSNGKTNVLNLVFRPSNVPVQALDAVPADIWATTATLRGRLVKADAANAGLQWRRSGESTWRNATVSALTDGVFTAQLSSLLPGTTYEYRAVVDGYEGTPKTFVTESALQLPNAGFENWQDSKAPFLIYGEGQEMFWDSGNHGSATMKKNVTVPATNIKHSGERSVLLQSQFVGVAGIGKFAAGNMFVGQYLETVGTNGVIGWGRPFASRPKVLKGWMHFTPQAVTHTSVSGVNKGDMDQGMIFVAILDNSTTEYRGYRWPVMISTADNLGFDPNAPNVIAYGQMVLDTATPGSDMVPFTIELVYRRTDVKGSNIVITAAASRYGDSFTGGPSSLYLDDLEMAY